MNEPKYKRIYAQLLRRIQDGTYAEGDRLPSENELSQQCGVSRITSKRVLEILAERGMVERRPGKGTFVRIRAGGAKREPGGPVSYKTVGVLIDDINNVFGTGILLTVEDLAKRHNCFLIPQIVHGRREDEETAIRSLMDFGVDGILSMASHGENISSAFMQLVIDKTPLVLVDRFLKGIPAPFVGTDNVTSTVAATDYLFGLGHRHISFLSRPYFSTTTVENRVAGFIKSHAQHGIAIDESEWVTDIQSVIAGCYSPETVEEDIRKIRAVLTGHPDITCLFASEYNIALLARKAVFQMGLRIPEDISIFCFDGSPDFLGESFFTRAVQMEEQIGTTAFELLLNQMEKGISLQDKQVFYVAQLQIGRSTGKPRAR